MNININLDKFKPFFKSVVNKLEYGIGFNLYVNPKDHDDIKLQASRGTDKGNVFYNSVVKIITNPKEYFPGIEYQPPSDSEFLMSIGDYMKGTQVTIVVERKGFWIFSPNTNLISLINHYQPELLNEVKELEEGSTGYSFPVNEDVKGILQIISHNIQNYNVYLGYSKDLVKIDHPEIEKHYDKINLKDYILYMHNVLNDEDYQIGYNVEFVPWDSSLNFNIYLNEVSKKILKNIEKRGMNEWEEYDIDLFIKTARKAKELTIIHKKK